MTAPGSGTVSGPTIGTPLTPSATRVLPLGSGELGKEVPIELQRPGCEGIAAGRYAHAPAMRVAHRSHVPDMLNPAACAPSYVFGDSEAERCDAIAQVGLPCVVKPRQESWQPHPTSEVA